MPKRSRGLTQAAQNFLNAFNMGKEFQDRVAEEFNRLYIEYQLKYHEKPNMLKRPII